MKTIITLLAAAIFLTSCKKEEKPKFSSHIYNYRLELINYTNESLLAADKYAKINEVIKKNGVVFTNTKNTGNSTISYEKNVEVKNGDVIDYSAVITTYAKKRVVFKLVLFNLTLNRTEAYIVNDTLVGTSSAAQLKHTAVVN